MPNFSVLMSVYCKETACNLDQCLESLAFQTLPANEIVIVKDGMLNDELEKTLMLWQEKLPLKIVGYEENKGLGYALNYGLKFCSHELVARMDSDDICILDRFEKQVSYFERNEKVSLLSGYINEFNNHPNDIVSIRKVPVGRSEIIKYLKKRNAFNHVAVMFRKSAVITVGSYQKIDSFEDYDLWIRLVQAGYNVDNIPEILVYVRIGNNMIMRRRSLKYVKKEVDFLRIQRNRHFISNIEFIMLLLLRVPIRLIPVRILSRIYYIYFRET
jgi:glycosyltransferase involved in cell wall biosynthesis